MDDLSQLVDLARQFVLLNLPADRKVLSEKIERSMASFRGELEKKSAEYLFVVEDTEEQAVVGSSLIVAKHGTDKIPHYYFKVSDRNHVSADLGIGFIHKVLRFQEETDGPTEVGGLLVNKLYRKRTEKLGKQISLIRFLYMALHPERFEKRALCELAPPLTDEGRSEFWESLGRRFTGLPYQEADMLSQSHKEFISSLFPDGDIYLCLLSSKARLVLGRVSEQTRPAQHLLESIGFRYADEVDPFDGGPHYRAEVSELLPIKQGRALRVQNFEGASYNVQSLIGFVDSDDEFRGALVACDVRDNQVAVSSITQQTLGLENGQSVWISPFYFPRPSKEQL